MFERITVARLSTWTLFKLAGIGLTLGLLLFAVLVGVLSQFGLGAVTVNGQPITGTMGLLISPLIGFALAVGFTVLLGACMALGLWLYSLLAPITLVVKLADPPAQE